MSENQSFEEYWAQRRAAREAFDFTGWKQEMLERNRTTHVYKITKPDGAEWPSDMQVCALWVDSNATNFGISVGQYDDPNARKLTINVD